MESDSDYEVEDSVLLHVEAPGVIQEDFQQLDHSQISFIQVDTESPLVQLGHQVYTGTYEDTVSTSLFFTQRDNLPTEDSTGQAVDPVFGRHVPTQVEFLDSTRKKLKLKRVFLKPKPGLVSASSTGTDAGRQAKPGDGESDAASANQNYSTSDENQVNLSRT
jgi:general transcription factor 3C polypeptide 6